MSARRLPLNALLVHLGACNEALRWSALQEAVGATWESSLATVCTRPVFDQGVGEDWLEWLIVRLADTSYLAPADVLRAEARVWRRLPVLIGYADSCAWDEFDAWAASGGPAPDASRRRAPGPARVDGSPRVVVDINLWDLRGMAARGDLYRFSGTWGLSRHALAGAEGGDAAIDLLARAIHDEHGPLVLGALAKVAGEIAP